MIPEDAKPDPIEQAALAAAGAIPWEDAAAPQAELRSFAPVVQMLAGAVAPVNPPARVRAELLAKIASDASDASSNKPSPQVWKTWAAVPEIDELYIRRTNEGTWEQTGVSGVSVRQLFVDRPGNRITMLVRMAPGSSYPRHVHDGPEECLVLEGDLSVGDTVLHPGDYQRAAAGSRHGVQSTNGGCLLLITSSLSDELY